MLVQSAVLAVSLGIASLLIEAAAVLSPSRQLRNLFYALMIVLAAPAAAGLAADDLRLGTVLIALVAAFRIFNGFRAISGRTKEERLRHAVRRTSLFLIIWQLAAAGVWQFTLAAGWHGGQMILALSVVSLAASAVILRSTLRTLDRTRFRSGDRHAADAELPTVSVCVPARNESDYLPACLESILASDYPKLEILVLDDCSQDNTSEIIKGFAQKGVRFIKGEPPKSGWLAKNQAYQALSEAASGELLLFCGVDTRFERRTVRALVSLLKSRGKQMASVMPKAHGSPGSGGLLQPMRYWWELVLPRRLFNRPPVLSTAWIISREALKKHGGFKAVRRSVLPEGYFARELAGSDSYSFVRSGGSLALATAKRLPEQWQTAVRMRYPQARKRPENVLVISLALLWFVGLPVGLVIAGFFRPLGWLGLVALANLAVLLFVHYLIVRAWGLKEVWTALALFPAAVASELAAGHLSMWRYEFGEVDWKGRDICIPAMKHYRRLPD